MGEIMTKNTSVTNEQINAHRERCLAAGDLAGATACAIALGQPSGGVCRDPVVGST
jgi:hypothetical protein